MREYIKTLIQEEGMTITPETLTIIEIIIERYTTNLALEALHCAQYHGTIWKQQPKEIYDDDLQLIIENNTRRIRQTTHHQLMEDGLLCNI